MALATKLHWSKIVWAAGLANIYATIPQLVQIWDSRDVSGLSLQTFSLYFVIQVVLAAEGYFKHSANVMWTLGACSLVTLGVIISILYLR